MTSSNQSAEEKVLNADDLMAEFDRESNTRRFSGFGGVFFKVLFVTFAIALFATRFFTLPEQVRMSAFLGVIMFLGFLIYPLYKKQTKRKNHIPWYDFILAVVAATPFMYYAIFFDTITDRALMITPLDKVMGVIGVVMLFELCRRAVGVPILFVAGAFILYAFWYCKDLPYVLHYIVYNIFYTTSGIFGTPLNVCSTFIVFFIILGAFLEKTGIGNFFVDLANSIAGWASGGPAKVAVISSALEGMYSGSSVANTVGSGSITIPTMKKIGYKPEFAAAVEAAASTGGQIMPPIMGAAAFLMSEMTEIPYPTIAVAAILPAVLYFAGIFMMIHFEAKKMGLRGLPKESIPNFFLLLIKKWYLLLPIIVLVSLMTFGSTPAQSACMAIMTTLVIMLITDIVKAIANKSKSFTDYIVVVPVLLFIILFVIVGKAKMSALEDSALISGAAYIILSFIGKHSRSSGKTALDALETGVKNTMGVSLACALAGIVAGVVTLTSLGSTLIDIIVPIANNNLFLALFLTMVTCIVLGMGVPTTANYLIMATITAPILIKMGLPPLAAHMFVFYFGIVADITPPVALAAYAGSAIAGSNPLKTGVNATRLAITAFIIPYIFAFNPKMLFIEATVPEVILIIITSCLGIFSLSGALEGYMFRKLKIYEILLLVAGGLLLIYPGLRTDLIGILLISIAIVLQIVFKNKEKKKNRQSNKVRKIQRR